MNRAWLAWALGLALTATPFVDPQAAYWSEVSIAGTGMTGGSEGGNGVRGAWLSDAARLVQSDHVQTAAAQGLASAAAGALLVDLEGGGNVSGSAPQKRSTGAAGGSVFFSDQYTVGAGSSGASSGDPVQVRLEVELEGAILLVGTLSSSSFAELDVDATGIPGSAVLWQRGSIGPPYEEDVDERWELLVDTTVGASIVVSGTLDVDLNGSLLDPGASGNNVIRLWAVARLSPAPGHELLEIVSEAGAPTTAISRVPALGPWALVLLAISLSVAALPRLRSLGARR